MEAEKEVSGTGGDSCDLRADPNPLSHKALQTLVFGRGMGPLSRKGWQKGLIGPVKYHPFLRYVL